MPAPVAASKTKRLFVGAPLPETALTTSWPRMPPTTAATGAMGAAAATNARASSSSLAAPARPRSARARAAKAANADPSPVFRFFASPSPAFDSENNASRRSKRNWSGGCLPRGGVTSAQATDRMSS